jgi:hypothetical protein
MSPKLKISLQGAKCAKPGCRHNFKGPLHRHHMGHEKSFINHFTKFAPPRRSWETLKRLTERYEKFRPRDVVDLCAWHHAEIHEIYTDITFALSAEAFARYKLPWQLSWKTTFFMIRRYRKACREWLKKKTPGMRPF